LAALALLSTDAAGQRFYVGASGGTTHVDPDMGNLAAAFPATGPDSEVFVTSATVDRGGSAGRLFGGMRVTDWLALEVDYTHLGHIEASYTEEVFIPPLGQVVRPERTDSRARAFGVSIMARAPLSDALVLFGRAGAARTRLESTTTFCRYQESPHPPRLLSCANDDRVVVNETRPVAGVGLDWRFAERAALRVSWDRYFGVGNAFEDFLHTDTRGEFDIDYFGIGATFNF
jgi:hypothetical protein